MIFNSETRKNRISIRHFWVLVHRYVGLAMAVFLVLVGLTGSLLAFYSELDRLVCPQFFVANTGSKPLDIATLAENAALLEPKAQVDSVWFDHDLAQVQVYVSPRIDPQTQQSYELDFEQLMLNPFTGEELGRRNWGAISEGFHNLMPFIYKLHYSLALEDIGTWMLGITALVWTLDCFVGFYLTLPTKPRIDKHSNLLQPRSSFWQRWQIAWKIKWRASAKRVTFDLHRASGLWLWLMLLVFAWSSVYMNLWDTVYTKTTQLVFDYHAPWTDLPNLDKPLENPTLTWRQAYERAVTLSNVSANEQHFIIDYPVYLILDRDHGVFDYKFRSSLDFQDKFGGTRLFFDANTGEQKLLLLPSGQYNGNTVTQWLVAWHIANVFGMPYRIFVFVLGLAIVMLSVTGVLIWWAKTQSEKFKKRNC